MHDTGLLVMSDLFARVKECMYVCMYVCMYACMQFILKGRILEPNCLSYDGCDLGFLATGVIDWFFTTGGGIIPRSSLSFVH